MSTYKVILPVTCVTPSVGALPRNMAHVTAVVALAVVAGLVWAVPGQVAAVAAGVAHLVVALGAVLLHMARLAAVVAGT